MAELGDLLGGAMQYRGGGWAKRRTMSVKGAKLLVRTTGSESRGGSCAFTQVESGSRLVHARAFPS
jgi:hypothetical protein